MGLVAFLPVAQIQAANASLQAQGFGPGSFKIPIHGIGSAKPTQSVVRAWTDPALWTAIKALPGVTWTEESDTDTVGSVAARVAAQSLVWTEQRPVLPSTGTLPVGSFWKYGGEIWRVLQAFDRSTFGQPPETYPALIVIARNPFRVYPWVQPLGSFDAFLLVNPFTGQPDRVSFQGKTWAVSQQSAAGGFNTFSPAAFGWTEVV